MTDEQGDELARIRQEQRELRAALEALDARITVLSKAGPVVRPRPAPSPAAPPPLPRAPEPAPAPIPPVEPLEVRLGAKWFVRLAVFMLIAALAFLANYLYQNVVPHLGPAAKVGLLYLGSGALAGFGFWLERSRQTRENPGLLNYARVVFAGGLAAVYYVTYAAHHYERLRVIESSLLAGLLLLGWTAFMAWLADRRNSQTLAAFSMLLAYYSSATSDVAGFTLTANLGLTIAAMFLVLRRRWTVFGFASLAATYGSCAFWRFSGLLGYDALHPTRANLWVEGAFLACYWALFTASVFVDRRESLRQGQATFISLNNGALFSLVGLLVRDQYPGEFWKWSFIFGAVLLALGEVGRRLSRPLEPASVDSYHFGGVGLITLGTILYFSGWQLGVILAVESATVLGAALRRKSLVLFVAAFGIAALGVFFTLIQTLEPDAHWLPEAISGAVLIFNAWRCNRRLGKRAALGEGVYALGGLAIWFAALELQITAEPWRAPILAAAALALTGGFYLLGLRVALCFAQAFLAAAYGHWLSGYGVASRELAPPLWSPGFLLLAIVALGAALKKGAALIYEGAAFLLFAIVAFKYFDGADQFIGLIAGGAATLALAHGLRRPRLRWWGIALDALAILVFMATTGGVGVEYLLGIAVLAAEQWFVRSFGAGRELRSRRFEGALISCAALCVWVWISRQIHQHGWPSFATPAGWSLYGGALFGIGLAVRERVCRWWGLGVIAAALAHIVIIDIWTLDNLERFVSLFVISMVLLGVGFFYNRLSSSIREWL